MKQVAVIGGGASGFAAAITIAEKSKDFTVSVYEKLQKPFVFERADRVRHAGLGHRQKSRQIRHAYRGAPRVLG